MHNIKYKTTKTKTKYLYLCFWQQLGVYFWHIWSRGMVGKTKSILCASTAVKTMFLVFIVWRKRRKSRSLLNWADFNVASTKPRIFFYISILSILTRGTCSSCTSLTFASWMHIVRTDSSRSYQSAMPLHAIKQWSYELKTNGKSELTAGSWLQTAW